MKSRLTYLVAILLMCGVCFAIVTKAQTPTPTTEATVGINNVITGNDQLDPTGWLLMECLSDSDTMSKDVAGVILGTEKWIAAQIAYRVRIWNGTIFTTQDSISTRLRYRWSSGGDTWLTDSSALIQDTLYHLDTIKMHPYRMLQVEAQADTLGANLKTDGVGAQLLGFTIYPVLR